VAHQFNNALTGLVGNIDLISMVVQNESAISPYIERTRPIIERMSNLTRQLLAYARGVTFLSTQAISLKDLLNEVLPSIKNALKETVALTVEPVDQAATLDVDLIQMRTAIQAIVNNADESIADDGSIRILSQVTPWDHIPDELSDELKPGDYARIQIEDSGAGMDEDTRRRLFEPFFSTKFEGRGLSMAAVSSIIKSHHGGITVFSQVGTGTIVNLFLPAILSE
jgi:signal transduction histidine kinase